MKITCESCQTKYTIADEKVAGKTVKIKCKKCGHAIVVHGGASDGVPSAVPSLDASAVQDEAEAKLVTEGAAPAAEGNDEWTVNVAEGDERIMTTAQLVAEYARGAFNADTYVWKEGMSDWLPITSVPELQPHAPGEGGAALKAAAVATPLPGSGRAAPAAIPATATPLPGSGRAAAAAAPAAGAPVAAAAAAAPAAAPRPPAAAAAPGAAPPITSGPVGRVPLSASYGPEGTVVMRESASDRPGAPRPIGASPTPAAAPTPVSAPAPAAVSAPAPAAVSAPAVAPAPAPAAAPAPAPAAAAARRAGRAPAVDVFSAAEHAAESPAAPAQTSGTDRLVGERNENSVLFSLSALTAVENAAKEAQQEDSPAGRRTSSRPAPKSNGRAGLDDILNLGGGSIASPMLAPPPLLAPVADSVPPPRSSVAAAAPSAASSPLTPFAPVSATAPPAASAAKRRLGLIAAAAGAVALVVGVGWLSLRSPDESTSATTTPEQVDTAAANTASPAETAPPAETAAAATPPPETSPSAEPTASASADAPPPAAEAAPAETAETAEKPADSRAAEKPADKPAVATPTPAPAPAQQAKPAVASQATASAGEFNRGAATSALGAAAASARSCKKAGGPTGTGRVRVTFAPNGTVTSAQVVGAPFAGTSVGGCIAGKFRSARVPPFGGSPITVTKSFSIN